jgi:lipopolysaccharide export system permease protein
MKKSMPIACLIFGLTGMAYCLTFIKSGKDWWGVIISICAAVLTVGFYFFIVAFFRALAKDGSLSPFLGAWIPNIAYGSISCVIIVKHILNR